MQFRSALLSTAVLILVTPTGADAQTFRDLPSEMRTDWEAKITIDVQANRIRRLGDENFDDQRDSYAFKLRFKNNDRSTSFEGLTGELWIFGRSTTDRRAYKLVARETYTFDLPPSLDFAEMAGPSFELEYDDKAHAKYGYKYEGFVFLLKNAEGKVMGLSSNLSWVKSSIEKLSALQAGSVYSTKLEPYSER